MPEKQSPPHTARALRSILRSTFPETVFRVRCERGTGYGWISCSWYDGPTEDAVRLATGPVQPFVWSSCGLNLTRFFTAAAEAWADREASAHSRWVNETDNEFTRHYFATRRALTGTDLRAEVL